MNIKRAKQEIIHSIAAYLAKDEYGEYRIPPIRQRPILLMGAPGIGKTQIMEQIAGECDLALVSYTITHHTRQSAIGLPFIREKEYAGQLRSVTEYTMSEIIATVYDRMEASGKKEGILFIDEINCVSETLAPMMLQFLQCKSFGNQQVPPGWIIVAAGNPPEYNKSVREFDVVTLDRVKVINVEADFPVWKEYAYQAGIHGSILSYLDIHRENFYRMETTVDGKQFVTARGWQDLSEMIYAYEKMHFSMDQEVIVQYLQHPKVAKDFANYLELYYKYQTDYQVEEILQGIIRPGTLNKLKFAPFDERLKVVSLLLSRLSESFRENFELSACVDELFDTLKRFSVRLKQEVYDSLLPEQILRELLEKKEREVTLRELAGQNEREHASRLRKVFAVLDSYVRLLEKQRQEETAKEAQEPLAFEGDLAQSLKDQQTALEESSLEGSSLGSKERGWGFLPAEREAAFALLQTRFSEEVNKLESETSFVYAQLEAAFDFMEAAFGESQEMVVFITELSVNSHAVWFLQQNECPRYYKYNKSLLFDEQQEQIKEKLNEIRSGMVGEQK